MVYLPKSLPLTLLYIERQLTCSPLDREVCEVPAASLSVQSRHHTHFGMDAWMGGRMCGWMDVWIDG